MAYGEGKHMTYDIIIKNGTLIDPATGREEKGDLLIRDGLIADAPAKAPADATAKYMLDAAGMLVMPGLIDFHTHVYMGGSDLGVNPHTTLVHQGVTMTVDTGTAGTGTMAGFIPEIEAAQIRMKAFVNITPSGLATFRTHNHVDAATFDVPRLKQLFRDYGQHILGIKYMAGAEINHDLKALDATLAIAEEIGVPVAVHTTDPAEPMAAIARRLRKGDILVHFLHGIGNTIIDPDGRVNKDVLAARERGVYMDASNGSRHFSFAVAKAALEQGVFPDVISSDLTAITLYTEPVFGLPHLLSKYLNMGMPLMDVIRCATTTPAKLCRMEGRLGALAPGAYADVTVMHLVDRDVTFRETAKPGSPTLRGTRYLLPRLTVIKGVPAFRSPDMPAC